MSRPFRNPLARKLIWKLEGRRLVVPPQWGLTTANRLSLVLLMPAMLLLGVWPKHDRSLEFALIWMAMFGWTTHLPRERFKGRRTVERTTRLLIVNNREFLPGDFDAIVVGPLDGGSQFARDYRVGLKRAGAWKQVVIVTDIELEEDTAELASDLQKITGYPVMMPGEHYC